MNPREESLRAIGVSAIVLGLVIAGIGFKRVVSAAHDSARGRTDHRVANVILLIGDGMGDSEITIARNYKVGAAGRLAMDTLPMTGSVTTYALEERDPSKVNYVTDSAASGTAWAAGEKTSNGRIATRAGSPGRAPLTTILELAQRGGYRTGDVTTAELTDATPAVLAAHVNSRTCEGPDDMGPCGPYATENGGPGSIAEQEVDHHVDVLLGGGSARFAQRIRGGAWAGRTVVEAATAQGYDVVSDAASLAHARAGRRVLGLFSNGNMTTEWAGAPAAPFPGSGPQGCIEDERARRTAEPSLEQMASKAIELLQQPETAHGSGFFLQVEGASIDKQDHAANPCGQIGETVAFDRAVATALAFARSRHDTLVIVTADHAHASQIVPVPAAGAALPGLLTTLTTKEGSTMVVSYATGGRGEPQEHTGAQVRVAAAGPQAARVLGMHDQTDLFHIIAQALGLDD